MKQIITKCLLLVSITVFLSTNQSCKKKDDSAPAPQTLQPKGGPADKSDPSTAISPRVPSIAVGATETKHPEDVKAELAGGDVNNFSALTGSTGSGLRRSEESFIGWFIEEVYVDGAPTSSQGLDQYMFFFDGDNGWYDIYDFESETWEWGWWYIDNKLDYIVFDDASEDDIYRVKSITSRRIVLENRSKDNDSIMRTYTYVFNSYDLLNPNDGSYEPTEGMKLLAGNTSKTFYPYGTIKDVPSDYDYTKMPAFNLTCDTDDDYTFGLDLTFNIDDKGTEADLDSAMMEICTLVDRSFYQEWWALLPDVNGTEDKIFYYLEEDGTENFFDVVSIDADNLVLKRPSEQPNFYDFYWLKHRK